MTYIFTVPRGSKAEIRYEDRRVATGQRRARGNGDPYRTKLRRRDWGRRAGDMEDHLERRVAQRRKMPLTQRHGGNRKNYFDRRTAKDTHIWASILTDPPERRSLHSAMYEYKSSRDPRIRALERRHSYDWKTALTMIGFQPSGWVVFDPDRRSGKDRRHNIDLQWILTNLGRRKSERRKS